MKGLRPDLPIIMCTGLDDGSVDLHTELGLLQAFFVKPVSPEEVGQSIRRIFDS